MPDRRATLLDAALEIVGRGGMRALTHRAIDVEAGLAPGSTSNYFRTRQALLTALTQRFVTREREMAEGEGGEVAGTPAGVAAALGRFAHLATTSGRSVTLARYCLLVEAAQRPEIAEVLRSGADQVDTWGVDLMSRAGSLHPVRDHGIVANYTTGLVLHQLALPAIDFDPVACLTALLDTLDWRSS